MVAEDLRYGTFRISFIARAAYIDEKEIPLTTTEFDLLWLLANHAGTVLSRDEIMANNCNNAHDGIFRAVDKRISRLRKLLGDNADNPRRIKTVRGQGYQFCRTNEN